MTKVNIIALIIVCAQGLYAQQGRMMTRVTQDQVVSFKSDVPLKSVLTILSDFSKRFENRIIIDPELRDTKIGVDVENMHWKRALEFILRSNLLKYDVYPRYYEIVPMVNNTTAQGEPPPADSETREVEINAVFFQADYTTLVDLGINWSTFKNGSVDIRANGANSVVQEFVRVSAGKTISGKVRVDALLRAFESRSQGEIIARPHIKVLDGQEGKIKVGRNFYLSLQDFAGNTQFSEYESGNILKVTPTIIGEGDSTFIHLSIDAERSDVQPDAIGVSKNITESSTQVLLLNGEETVIAGLLRQEKQNLRKGVPGLKDLPWWFFGLRYLFGYESESWMKKELVIFIRARIVPKVLSRRSTRLDLQRYLDYQQREFDRYGRRANKKNTVRRGRRTGGSRR